ncbi:UNVERIFIED_CONTAM: Jacalin-related lectin 19 [Sesamum calycinum]|uniref:Jacalin-related lectin 19 n=1 Tax=Sesamum calycinum TaxID=2727403 RepID=A0AAW2SWR4_9LAMI
MVSIDSIRVLYDKNGMAVLSEAHGGPGDHTNAEVKLQFPEEYLTEVSGHCFPLGRRGNAMVRLLKFRSNWRTYGSFGVESGTPFCLPMEGGKIVVSEEAITHTHSLALWSVVCISAILFLQLVNMDGENDHTGEKKAIVVGPWGGNGGTAWMMGVTLE